MDKQANETVRILVALLVIFLVSIIGILSLKCDVVDPEATKIRVEAEPIEGSKMVKITVEESNFEVYKESEWSKEWEKSKWLTGEDNYIKLKVENQDTCGRVRGVLEVGNTVERDTSKNKVELRCEIK